MSKNKNSRSKLRHTWYSSRPWWPSWLVEANRNNDKSEKLGGDEGYENIYHVSEITCPIAVFAGSEDHLIDPLYIQNNNASCCILTHIEKGYEHLDMIWADSAHEKIFPRIIEVIDALV